MFWEKYFEIYGFTQDNDDVRFAMLAMTIANMSGKSLKKLVKLTDFIPVYLPSEKSITDPLQRNEYRAFKQKLQDVNR